MERWVGGGGWWYRWCRTLSSLYCSVLLAGTREESPPSQVKARQTGESERFSHQHFFYLLQRVQLCVYQEINGIVVNRISIQYVLSVRE